MLPPMLHDVPALDSPTVQSVSSALSSFMFPLPPCPSLPFPFQAVGVGVGGAVGAN